MKNEKQDTTNQGTPQQASQDQQPPVNPFKETEGGTPQPSVEEETELEQQRKEAMTERD